jgi:hypothetical protein
MDDLAPPPLSGGASFLDRLATIAHPAAFPSPIRRKGAPLLGDGGCLRPRDSVELRRLGLDLMPVSRDPPRSYSAFPARQVGRSRRAAELTSEGPPNRLRDFWR